MNQPVHLTPHSEQMLLAVHRIERLRSEMERRIPFASLQHLRLQFLAEMAMLAEAMHPGLGPRLERVLLPEISGEVDFCDAYARRPYPRNAVVWGLATEPAALDALQPLERHA